MKPLYANVIIEDFLDYTKNNSVKFNFVHIKNKYDFQKLKTQLQNRTIPYPIVCLDSRWFGYVKDKIIENYDVLDSQKSVITSDFDYINTIPMNILPKFKIFSTDILELSSLEEMILSRYSDGQKLNIIHPLLQDYTIPFGISINPNYKIVREQKDVEDMHIYYSELSMIAYNCASFTEKYSAAQLELDKQIEQDIVERLAALEDIKTLLVEQNSLSNQDKITNVENAWNDLDSVLHATRGITTYHKLWEVMEQNGYCGIEEALKIIKENQARLDREAQEQEERVRNIEEMFSKNGDKVLNSYTDAVIENIRGNLKNGTELIIYGGSTYIDWWKQDALGTLQFPNILIHTDSNYTFANKCYNNVDREGNMVEHSYTQNALPIEYGIRVSIMAKEQSQVDDIENQIHQAYIKEKIVNIPDSLFEGEMCPIKLVVNSDVAVASQEISEETYGGIIYQTVITFRRFPFVYYPVEYTFVDIKNNQRLQFRLLQQAEFFLLCDSKFRNEAIPQLNSDYKNLFTLNQKKSFFNSMLGAVGSVFESQEYKQLKMCFKNRQPIDRNLFNAALNKITSVYPSLYDKMMQGWSFEQIYEDLKKYADFFNKKWNTICNNLAAGACPTFFLQLGLSGSENQPTEQIRKGLVFYINKMVNNPYCTLSDAKNEYEEQLRIEQQEAEEAARQAQEALEAWSEARQERRSSGSSGGILNTAVGVALGNKMSGISPRRDGKKDFMGSSGCMYGKKDESGFTIRCDIRCPLHRECTRYFMNH